MKAAVYNAAAGNGNYPSEVTLAMAIKKYGVPAVMGRETLSAGEMMRMNYCENVASAYKSRTAASNWAQWSRDNPELAAVLLDAEKVTNG